MKTYKRHGTCLRHTGCDPLPVRHDGVTLWTTRGDLDAMKATGDHYIFAAGTPRIVSDEKFDRIFSLVCDSKDWGIRCKMSLGEPWPQIELFSSESEARQKLILTALHYASDPRWRVRDRQCTLTP